MTELLSIGKGLCRCATWPSLMKLQLACGFISAWGYSPFVQLYPWPAWAQGLETYAQWTVPHAHWTVPMHTKLSLSTLDCPYAHWTVPMHTALSLFTLDCHLCTMDCLHAHWTVPIHTRLSPSTLDCSYPHWTVPMNTGLSPWTLDCSHAHWTVSMHNGLSLCTMDYLRQLFCHSPIPVNQFLLQHESSQGTFAIAILHIINRRCQCQ